MHQIKWNTLPSKRKVTVFLCSNLEIFVWRQQKWKHRKIKCMLNCKVKDTMKVNFHFKNLTPDQENQISKTVSSKSFIQVRGP